MFSKNSMKFLEALMNSASPSGYESEAAKIYRDYSSDRCEVRCDVMGNTIAALNSSAPVRVLRNSF
ncbi:MAG: M42 family metallopeptidase [Lentisphaerae bacterium]|nr:M42 family metallopeptidase [Lentisphaerota bacterium]